MNYFKVQYCLIVVLITLSFYFSACEQKVDLKALKSLDDDIRLEDSLFQFSSNKVSKKEINNTKVCYLNPRNCVEGEIPYSIFLKNLGISQAVFNEYAKRMNDLGFRKYYRYESYSIWIQGGALGNIFGYLINHDDLQFHPEPFRLNEFYFIRPENEVMKGVYYFTGE